MTISEEGLEELRLIYPGAVPMPEGGYTYAYLPRLKLGQGNCILIREGLLCLQARDGYATRLFLSEPVPGKGNNWTVHRILDKTWHTWSWNNVSPGRPAQVLAQHLAALR